MDEIQQKLALIDEQLAHGALRRLTRTAPLFFAALGLMTGILVQNRLLEHGPAFDSASWLRIWLVALGAGLGILGVYRVARRQELHPQTLAYGMGFCFWCLGAVRLLAYQRADPQDIRSLVGPDRLLTTVRGRILTEPYLERQDWCFAQFVPTDPSSSFYLTLDRLKTAADWQPARGTIRVQVDEPTPNLGIGDYVQAYCWLHRFEEPTNPGQFHLARHLRRRNVFVGASIPAREAIEVREGNPPGIWTRLRRVFTGAATQGLLDHPSSETQGEAMLEALLLGNRRNIDRDTNEAFRRTGLLHLISLSGMHMAIIVLAIWWFCKVGGLGRRTRAVVCSVAIAVFLLVVPPLSPILRAAITAWVYCLAVFHHRRVSPLNSLSLAAIILLLLRPTQMFEASWQLSFAGVGGILAFTQRIEDLLHRAAGGWFDPTDRRMKPMARLGQSAGRAAIQLLSVGVAAWLGSMGILLYHFYNITPLASVWTVLASLPVTAILLLGFLKILLSFLLPTVGILLGYPLNLLADLLIWMVKIMARIDFSYLQIGHVPLVLLVLYYVLILSATFVHLRRPIVKRGLCGAMGLALLIPLGCMKWQRTHRDGLILTCLDVGHGQAILAQLPGTANLLFDAGSLYGSDVGARIVIPFMDYAGISRLHEVIASHHDVDHINGIPEVVDNRLVKRVYAGETSFPQPPRTQTAELLLEHLRKRRIALEPVPATIRAGPAAQVHVLWPVGESPERENLSENDESLVCLIEFVGRRVLLCSDIERTAQQEILRRYPSLRADVVIVPHHGSVRTLAEDFLGRIEPSLLLCSCGRTDYEQGRTIREADGADLLVTARDGAVTVRIDRAGAIETNTLKQRE